MSNSRLSYTSAMGGGESDGEFCEPETPRASRTMLAEPPGQNLPRSNSDPSLAQNNDQLDSRIPDYNAPPPYAVTPGKVSFIGSSFKH